MKKIKLVSVITILLLAITLASVLVACDNVENNKEQDKATSFVSIDINPTVELVLDQNNKVMSVRAANEDAEVLLYGEASMVGLSVDVASKRIVDIAVSCGYISADEPQISVSVASDDREVEKQIFASINVSLSAIDLAVGVKCVVEDGVDYLLNAELEAIKALNEGKEGYDTLTVAKLKLVKSALIYDGILTMDDAVKLSVEQLAAKVEEANEYYSSIVNNAYSQAVNLAKRTYDDAVATYVDTAYTEIFAAKIVSQPLSKESYYALEYVAYRTAYRAINGIAATIREYAADPVIGETEIKKIAEHFGVTQTEFDAFFEALKNNEGKVTVDSVKEYINKQYRNMSEEQRETASQAFADVTAILGDVSASAEIVTASNGSSLNLAISALKLGLNLSVSLDADVANAIENISNISDVDDLLEAIQGRIAELEELMYEAMTADEEAELAEKMEKKANDIARLETQYNNAVAAAEAAAKDFLEEIKQAKINANVTIS